MHSVQQSADLVAGDGPETGNLLVEVGYADCVVQDPVGAWDSEGNIAAFGFA